MAEIRQATERDYGEIFTLQRAAFVDEARIYQTPAVPALEESLDELTARMDHSTSWVAQRDGRIIGSVSLRNYRDGGPDIERLMTAPDCRRQGLSRQLLAAAETHAQAMGYAQIQLIVGDLATANRAIYTHLGWTEVSSEAAPGYEHVVLHTMVKRLTNS